LDVVNKAKISCEKSGQDIDNHFAQIGEEIKDYQLSRYACYLIIQNANPAKEEVAKWQTYFATQVRKQEINDQYIEDINRKQLRDEMKKHNINLATEAKKAWVKFYWKFTNSWYRWLYDWLDASWIHKIKKLKKSEKILDHMWSEELAANLFRATQAEAKLKREKIKWQKNASKAHFEVWKKVRKTIKNLWGTMPEDLPTAENIKETEKRLENKLTDKNFLE